MGIHDWSGFDFTRKAVGVHDWSGKIVGVDVSVLFHALLAKGGKNPTHIRQLLAVNPSTSVYYLVAKKMNLWLINHNLHTAKAIVFVHDPALVDKYHCSQCREMCDEHLAVKKEISGRNATANTAGRIKKQWEETYCKYQELKDPKDQIDATPGLRDAWGKYQNSLNIVKLPMHQAFVAWVKLCNTQRDQAIALAAKTRGKTSSKKIKPRNAKKDKATWPQLICINSPVEADDQLAYLYRYGIIDYVFSVDTDFFALGCFNVINSGWLSVSNLKMFGYTEAHLFQQVAYKFGLTLPTTNDQRQKMIRTLICLISCIQGNDYIKYAMKPINKTKKKKANICGIPQSCVK